MSPLVVTTSETCLLATARSGLTRSRAEWKGTIKSVCGEIYESPLVFYSRLFFLVFCCLTAPHKDTVACSMERRYRDRRGGAAKEGREQKTRAEEERRSILTFSCGRQLGSSLPNAHFSLLPEPLLLTLQTDPFPPQFALFSRGPSAILISISLQPAAQFF